MVFPDPDSPTSPSVCPLRSLNETSFHRVEYALAKTALRGIQNPLQQTFDVEHYGSLSNALFSAAQIWSARPLMKSSITGSRFGRESSTGRHASSARVCRPSVANTSFAAPAHESRHGASPRRDRRCPHHREVVVMNSTLMLQCFFCSSR